MKNTLTILALTSMGLLASCSSSKITHKGLPVGTTSGNTVANKADGLNKDSLAFETRPSHVLLTAVSNVRLTTVYKINFHKDNKTTFIGSNSFHYQEEEVGLGNNWNNHLMPGIEAVYGYNFVNVSHYNIKENKQKLLFEKPVLIQTLYYPAYSKDTLNYKPINRDYIMVSVYNDDTNKDGYVNLKDLRRLYLFTINGEKQKALIPENYSVFKSEYDPENDFMYVFAQLDENQNGSRDTGEPIHVFWIALKDPNVSGRQY